MRDGTYKGTWKVTKIYDRRDKKPVTAFRSIQVGCLMQDPVICRRKPLSANATSDVFEYVGDEKPNLVLDINIIFCLGYDMKKIAAANKKLYEKRIMIFMRDCTIEIEREDISFANE